jgi:hypothetical protein
MRSLSFTIPSTVNLSRVAQGARPRLRAKICKLAAGLIVTFSAAEASDLRLLIDMLP